MQDRISRDRLYIEMASLMAKRSTCGRGQVGAIILKDGRIISTGYNGVPSNEAHCNIQDCNLEIKCTRALHAEHNAVLFAAREGISTENTTLYCTHSPCPECSKVILQAGITEVIYHTPYHDTSGLILLARHNIIIRQFNENA